MNLQTSHLQSSEQDSRQVYFVGLSENKISWIQVSFFYSVND